MGINLQTQVLLIGLLLVSTAPPEPPTGSDVRAVLEGRSIPVGDVHRYHCHDGAYPEVRCFNDEPSRDRDAGSQGAVEATGPAATTVIGTGAAERTITRAARLSDTTSASATYYVTFYEHANYGGASYTASQSISDLSNFGWNDAVTSFKSLSGQRPKWWENAGYTPPTWQWSAGAWVANVGSAANDRFSAVANVP